MAANSAEYADRMHLDRFGTLRQDERALRLTTGSRRASADYRIGARWVVRVSVQGVHAFNLEGNSYDALEIPISISRYWYPWW